MVLDGHMHIFHHQVDKQDYYRRLKEAGIDGGCLFSVPPSDYLDTELTNEQRLENVLDVAAGHKLLFPFYFLNPTEPDAIEQVERALASGIAGFKVICYNFFPGDERALKVYERIAAADKPIMFHSGILYNRNICAEYNRPISFEPLQNVKDIKFALAHVSWPWCDECISIYGKFKSMKRYFERNSINSNLRMFIDLAPGTPPIYRREVLYKLCNMFTDSLPEHMIFGVDGSANNYKVDYARNIIEADRKIYNELGIQEEVQDWIFHKNILKFLGK